MSSSSQRQSYPPAAGAFESDGEKDRPDLPEGLAELTEDELDSLWQALEEDNEGKARPFDIATAARAHGLELADIRQRIRDRR